MDVGEGTRLMQEDVVAISREDLCLAYVVMISSSICFRGHERLCTGRARAMYTDVDRKCPDTDILHTQGPGPT